MSEARPSHHLIAIFKISLRVSLYEVLHQDTNQPIQAEVWFRLVKGFQAKSLQTIPRTELYWERRYCFLGQANL